MRDCSKANTTYMSQIEVHKTITGYDKVHVITPQ